MPNNETPDIPIPETGISEETFEVYKREVDKYFKSQNKKLDWTFGFIVAVLIVCFLGFVTFLLDAWKFHSETNIEYSKTIEDLRKQNYDLKFNELSAKVDQIQDKRNQKRKSVSK